MLGYGNAAMHDGFDRSIRAQEAMVDGLLAALDLASVSFVGHDLGGGVGLGLGPASHRPDSVSGLVLSNAVCYDSWSVEQVVDLGLPATIDEISVDDPQELLRGVFRETLYGTDPSEEFVDGMVSQRTAEAGLVSLSRNAIGTDTSHTTEIDPSGIEAETLLPWGVEDEFQPVAYAERLEADVPNATLVGLDEASHWVPEDRTAASLDHLKEFLAD